MFRIRILHDLVKAHLEQEDREAVSELQLLEHLTAAGFRPDGEHWIVREKDLGLLQTDEVASIELITDAVSSTRDDNVSQGCMAGEQSQLPASPA